MGALVDSIGITCFTLEDEVFINPRRALYRQGISSKLVRRMIEGDQLRDWRATAGDVAIFPYDDRFEPVALPMLPNEHRFMWPYRTCLANNVMFGKKTKVEAGLNWWEYGRLTSSRLREPMSIVFAEVATHNHFVLDRGGQIFKNSAPVIKLASGASESEHLGLLGLLNSSVACFWLQQVCHNKGRPGAEVAGADERYEMRYCLNATSVREFPVVGSRPVELGSKLDRLANELEAQSPRALFRSVDGAGHAFLTRSSLDHACEQSFRLRRVAIAMQEELDWQCYGLYGLLPPGTVAADVQCTTPPEVALGERAFEIVMARRIAAGSETTTWFERHDSTPVTDIPSHWPKDYRQVVQRRIDLIDRDRNIGLIERPEYKRRWNTPAWKDLERAALRDWLLDRLEAPHLWPASADLPPQLTTVNRLADAVRADAAFMQIADLYAGHSGFDLTQIVANLVAGESAPFLPVLRYTDTGLRKRAQWEATWALQRSEDAIDAQVMAEEADAWRQELGIQARERFDLDAAAPLTTDAAAWVDKELAAEIKRYQGERKAEAVGLIPVPPKYQSKDFLKIEFWRLRGGLDVPKERWVSYPGCERGADTSLPIAWAGWNHLQQATALAAYYLEMKENEGWEAVRLQPLLAGLLELVPWLEQWHNEIDPAYGERMGNYYRGFVNEEARALGFTLEDLRAWRPAVSSAKRGRKAKA